MKESADVNVSTAAQQLGADFTTRRIYMPVLFPTDRVPGYTTGYYQEPAKCPDGVVKVYGRQRGRGGRVKAFLFAIGEDYVAGMDEDNCDPYEGVVPSHLE